MSRRIKSRATNEIFVKRFKKLYCEGATGVEMATNLHCSHQYVSSYYFGIMLTQKDLDDMKWNFKELHKEYDKLRSYRSPKEHRIEYRAQRLSQRIEKHSKILNT